MAGQTRSNQNGSTDGSSVTGGLLAFGRGGFDSASFGLGDKGVAAIQAGADALQGQNWAQRYGAIRAQQQAQDRYDQTHYGAYRNAGEVSGALLSLLATDGLSAGATAGRIAFTAPKVVDMASAVRAARPWAAAAGVGAGATVGGQFVSDIGQGRPSNAQTYLADALGGAAGGLATLKRGASAGAGAAAATTGAVQWLTGQPVDVADLSKAAVASGHIGRLSHNVATEKANDLHFTEKGKLGDWLAAKTSQIYGDEIKPPPAGNVRHAGVEVSGGHTIPDLLLGVDGIEADVPVEAKFGYKAELSKRQKEAFNELPNYFVYHFLPSDIGRVSGGLLSAATFPAATSALRSNDHPAPKP